ncbi:3-methyladenine DNA glycosylase [Bacillus infantis]
MAGTNKHQDNDSIEQEKKKEHNKDIEPQREGSKTEKNQK